MNVCDLSLERFAARLAGEGVAIRWGPFASRIVSRLPELAAPLHLLYADFPLEPSGDICDFHVSIRPRRLRLPWSDGQIELLVDRDRPFEASPRRFALPILEWGLNWCVYGFAHRFLVIHAAAVERGGSALLLPGRPGAGKSTLCAALVNAGWRLLSDELAVVDPTDGGVRALARPISLKDDSIEVVRRLVPGAVFGPRAVDTRKGTVAHMRPPAESVRRAAAPAWPRWVVMPRFAPAEPLRLRPVSKARAFSRLADNSLNYDILGEAGFRAAAGLIDRCDCHDLTFGALDDAVAALDALCHDSIPRAGRAAIAS